MVNLLKRTRSAMKLTAAKLILLCRRLGRQQCNGGTLNVGVVVVVVVVG
jgi:hypothetical protein